MGKTITIYFSDEALTFIEHLEGKGTLINELVINHFSNDEENIRRRITHFEGELAFQKKKLNDRLNEKEAERAKLRARQEVSAEQKIKNEVNELLTRAWQREKITDEEYYSCFIDGKLDIEKVKALQKEKGWKKDEEE